MTLDVEYFIHKTAIAFSKGMDIADIRNMLILDKLSAEEIYLIIAAGNILYSDWNEEDITKPDIKRII